ncbi:hypothetical protein M5V91_22760 [Cytobacillus pseudoceanisediminis]|uniref:hypothetical protein n=1 Tax=Cytobacillus pseudoceanisediminis TaxID=3051614 RepID=UPI00218C5F3E|nr:hypothetical protein [Cytobacillus pseudoceanisediminis]UQX53530.1 hypothetical protein M5V91_22760 [Cytobacillus pseudoceanisediminis]
MPKQPNKVTEEQQVVAAQNQADQFKKEWTQNLPLKKMSRTRQPKASSIRHKTSSRPMNRISHFNEAA